MAQKDVPLIPITKILIANRGEIARRVIRTCKKLGISTVAIYSESDAQSPFVKEADEAVFIGQSEPKNSYLRKENIIQVAKAIKADAIHPGYGFLSENAEFSALCQKNNITFIGPTPESIESMGSKVGAKRLLSQYDPSIPLIPGFHGEDQTDEVLMREAERIGFPILLKASAGGGGKGMRIVRESSQLKDAIDSAKTEAKNSFGDSFLLIEKYFDTVRHIEFQIFGDRYGNVVHIYERECSVQRRHQKVIEETPSVVMTPSLREAMGKAAVSIGRAISYLGAGTVEFIVDEQGKFYFLEVNTRLQVEHPITEAITGLDLVDLQIQVARGKSLESLGLYSIPSRGHAIECRLYAEDPANHFFPCTGRIVEWRQSSMEGIRYDTGIESGSEISIYYDPLISKVIAYGETREVALQKLDKALQETVIFGLTTNKTFLQQVLRHPEFRSGNFNTHFIENHLPEEKRKIVENEGQWEIMLAAFLWDWRNRHVTRSLWKQIPSGFRNNPYKLQHSSFLTSDDGSAKEYTIEYTYVHQGHTKQTTPAGHRFQVRCNITKEGENGEQLPFQEVILLPPQSHHDESVISCVVEGTRRNFVIAVDAQYRNNQQLVKMYGHSDVFGDLTLFKKPRLPPAEVEQSLDSGYSSPMPGKIIKVVVQSGQSVKKGDPLVVMESMKMESKIYSKQDGKVKLFVKEGDLVEGGAALLTVE